MSDQILSKKVLDSLDDIQQSIFPVYKPLGWTSFDVVKYLKGRYKIKKIGHGGTLDPLATGVVLIFTGKNTKKISEYQKKSKTYIAKIVFGATTKSLDSEFFPEKFVDTSGLQITKVEKAIKKSFIGQIAQIPPIFSALKYEGKPLYKIARNEKKLSEDEVSQLMQKKKRFVDILSFDIVSDTFLSISDLPHNSHLLLKDGGELKSKNESNIKILFDQNPSLQMLEIQVRITCSSGTYIRSLARDLAYELGFEGYLTYLDRTEEYGFKFQDM